MADEDTISGGRPSLYKPEYAIAGRLYAIRLMSDEQMAAELGVDLLTLAEWAFEVPEFYKAITPEDEEISKWVARRATAKRGKQRRAAADKSNPSARVRNSTRARMWAALKGRTDGKLFSRLGYSADDLVAHLTAHLKDGMTWANYGKWHIDHKKPCAAFDMANREQFNACWALSNLQPMWAADNVSKGAKWKN